MAHVPWYNRHKMMENLEEEWVEIDGVRHTCPKHQLVHGQIEHKGLARGSRIETILGPALVLSVYADVADVKRMCYELTDDETRPFTTVAAVPIESKWAWKK